MSRDWEMISGSKSTPTTRWPRSDERGAYPAHAGPGIEDPGTARRQHVGQPGLALDVLTLGDQPGEVRAVPTVAGGALRGPGLFPSGLAHGRHPKR